MADDVTQLLQWLRDERTTDVEFACAEHPSPRLGPRGSVVVRLDGCAADLGDDICLLLAAHGVRVWIRVDGCSRADDTRRAVERMATLLAAAGAAPDLVGVTGRKGMWPREVRTFGSFVITRRQLFLLPQGQGTPTPELPGTPRERAVFALRRITNGTTPPALAGLPAPSAHLDVQGCTGCGVCVRACPEDALRLARGTDTFNLVQRVHACTDCRACVRLCPEQAIRHVGEATWGSVLEGSESVLAEGRSRVCARCGTHFMPTGDGANCPPCAFRLANPFGSRTPGA